MQDSQEKWIWGVDVQEEANRSDKGENWWSEGDWVREEAGQQDICLLVRKMDVKLLIAREKSFLWSKQVKASRWECVYRRMG